MALTHAESSRLLLNLCIMGAGVVVGSVVVVGVFIGIVRVLFW